MNNNGFSRCEYDKYPGHFATHLAGVTCRFIKLDENGILASCHALKLT